MVAAAQLSRLGVLTDCVYAVALILVIQWLPLPSESSQPEGGIGLGALFAEHAGHLVSALIAIAFIILYWLRSTDLGSRLQRTDNVHVSLSILSVAALLFLLYMVRISESLDLESRLIGESVAVALIGIFSGLAFWRARTKQLLLPEIGAEEAAEVQIGALTEPLTALFTLPFVWMGELSWNLAWLAWVPLARLLGRRIVRRAGGGSRSSS